MNNLNLKLLDTGENFILLSDDTETEFEYGRFALSLANTDYDDMYIQIENFIKTKSTIHIAVDLQNNTNTDGLIKPEIANLILQPLYKELAQLLSKEYLNEYQARIISLFIMAEVRTNITTARLDLSNPASFIPLIFSNQELHQHIKDVLLQKEIAFGSPLQELLDQVQLSTSFVTLKNGISYQCYCIENMLDYLIIDLQKHLSSKSTINECLCCQKLFIPKYRISEKYCYFNNSACKDKMKSHPNDEFTSLRNYFRGYQSGRVGNESTKKQYPKEFLGNLYAEWSLKCTEKYIEYKSNDDLQGFKDWFELEKFSAKKLQSKYKEWKMQQNNG